MLNYILVFLGAGTGGVSRFRASGFIANRYGHFFPWGTLSVNVTGWLFIGRFATLTTPEGRWLVGPSGRNFSMRRSCGGYTTFSSFSLQTLNLAQDEAWLYAGGSAAFDLALCLVAVWLDHVLAEVLKPAEGI